jgi:Leucine-rich repeat (LRR) protein
MERQAGRDIPQSSAGHGVAGGGEAISLPLSPLRKLESLSIMGGALDQTDFLASMTCLRYLRLSCDYKSFPAGFEKLDKLEEISIWGATSLSVLPECLGSLPSLKRLYLVGCGVKSLPKSVREREGLHIDVRYCPVLKY